MAVVAVNSNDADAYPEDSFAAMTRRAREHYLCDSEQALVRALGSQRTPEVFVFDRNRILVYHGAVDDDREGEHVTRSYLRDAVDAVLAGRLPEQAETQPVGCGVKWRNA